MNWYHQQDLITRGYRALCRRYAHLGGSVDIPNNKLSGIIESIGHMHTIELRNIRGVIGTFRYNERADRLRFVEPAP